MGGMIGNNKKRISMSSSSLLFSPINNNNNNNNNNNEKSSIIKRFQANHHQHRVVGLGIVAALGEGEEGDTSSSIISSSSSTYYKKEAFFFPNINPPTRKRRSTTTHHRSPAAAVSPRSNPIPILTPLSKPPVVQLPILNHHHHHINNNNNNNDEMELSEEYTCVISHIGHNLIKKTEYFDSGVLAALHTHSSTVTYSGGGDEVAAVKTESFQAADFLKSCYLCDKHLHGLDIFMYRGEKAFCSAECRYEQMVKDERKEKEKEKLKKKNRGSLGKEATTMKTMMMNKPSFEFSSSTPCSSPIQLIAGIVAA